MKRQKSAQGQQVLNSESIGNINGNTCQQYQFHQQQSTNNNNFALTYQFPSISQSIFFKSQIYPYLNSHNRNNPSSCLNQEYIQQFLPFDPSIIDIFDNQDEQLCNQPLLEYALVPSYRIRDNEVYFNGQQQQNKQKFDSRIKNIVKNMNNKLFDMLGNAYYLIQFKQIPIISDNINDKNIRIILYKVYKIKYSQKCINTDNKHSMVEHSLQISQILVQQQIWNKYIPLSQPILIKNKIVIKYICTNINIITHTSTNHKNEKIIVIIENIQNNKQYIYTIQNQKCQINDQKKEGYELQHKHCSTLNQMIKHIYYFEYVMQIFYPQHTNNINYQLVYTEHKKQIINEGNTLLYGQILGMDYAINGQYYIKFKCIIKYSYKNTPHKKSININNTLLLFEILLYFHDQLNLALGNTSYQPIPIALSQQQSQSNSILVFADFSQLQIGSAEQYAYDIISLINQILNQNSINTNAKKISEGNEKQDLIQMYKLKMKDILHTVDEKSIVSKFKELVKIIQSHCPKTK